MYDKRIEDMPTDLLTLHEQLNKAKIPHEYFERHKPHKHVTLVYPHMIGTHQILIGGRGEGKKISIIRGAITFGAFELYGEGFEETERFEKEEDVIHALRKVLQKNKKHFYH